MPPLEPRLTEVHAMSNKPTVEAQITFLTEEAGGRASLPDFSSGSYMPHIVVQPPHVRKAVLSDSNLVAEDYLGVRFLTGPRTYAAGQSGLFAFELTYFPEVNYASIKDGATFTIREGGKVVGFGEVMLRKNLSSTQ